MAEQHYDCLIIGAGISGINSAYHLQKYCPWATFAVLERRSNLGGTWDLFKYPGIRSDSDMYTFGFSWKIWESPKAIAPAQDILEYLQEAAKEQGIVDKIIFNTDLKSADWTSSDNKWHLVTTKGEKFSCSFMIGCTGYFSYENPHIPTFKGQEDFNGTIVHPQNWLPEHDKEMIGKKVAIIGSGATAVTLLPSISGQAEHVTMVQRTPTYIGVKPEENTLLQILNRLFSSEMATKINRWINVILMVLTYQLCVRFPNLARRAVEGMMFKQVKSVMTREEFSKHFSPPYTPWQQRLCLAPQGDFFHAIRKGQASVVTGHIDCFTPTGIKMKDGSHVESDMIIVSTGLTIGHNIPFSTMKARIDGVNYKPSDHLIYKGCMLADIPNMAFVMGYTNASWTLKADIASLYFTRLLNFMNDNRVVRLTPREDKGAGVKKTPFNGGLTAGYLNRDAEHLPVTGDKAPWLNLQNYLYDFFQLSFKSFSPDSMELVKDDVEVKKVT